MHKSSPLIQDVRLQISTAQAYQDILRHLGLKDDRIRRAPLRRKVLVKRLLLRLLGAAALFTLALPGLILWLPVFATASFFGWRMRSSGRIEDGEGSLCLIKPKVLSTDCPMTPQFGMK